MRRLRHPVVLGIALVTATAVLPPASAADVRGEQRPSQGDMAAVIRYTEHGIPHILAKDYADLGFGTGWAQAADHVCVLADGFVTVGGQRSQYFGADDAPDGSLSSASSNLSSDLYFRGVRQTDTVQKILDQPAPKSPGFEVRELMRGWAAGYNAWLAQNTITDPASAGAGWVRPVTALDVAARDYALALLGGQGYGIDGITDAKPPGTRGGRKEQRPGKLDQAEAVKAARKIQSASTGGRGSNAVAFHGSTTANGRGLLLGNPHYPWHGGGRFWQMQQTIPGLLDVAGGSLLGTTTMSIGHTAKVAWSHTVATGVTFNLHELKLDPADPTAYLVDGTRERMTKRTVTVGGVTRSQWWTRYGPVLTSLGPDLPLPWTTATAYAIHDPNALNLRAADTELGFSKARSTDDILQTLRRTQGLPWVNTIAADSSGHGLFTQSQVLPRITDDLAQRCSTELGQALYPASGIAILDGSRGSCALGSDADALQPGIFGPAKMPTLKDAPYAENSNDSAWLTNAERPITGFERVFGPIGTERLIRTRGAVQDVAAMASRGGLTVQDLQKHQFANKAPAGDLVAKDAADACAALPGGTATGSDGKQVDVSQACGVLASWDRTTNTGSRGAVLFDRFWRKLATPLPPPADVWKVPFSASDPVRTPRTLNTGSAAFTRALADAVSELRTAGVPLDGRLGDNQYVVRGGKRIPMHGGTEALGVWNKIEPVWGSGGYTEVAAGSSYVQAVGWDGSACPVARTLLTYSQSSNPKSPYFSDQTQLYGEQGWVTSRFCENDIMASPALRVVAVREQ